MPRKRGPGITDSDILVINKIDIAKYVRTDLGGDGARRPRRARRQAGRADQLAGRCRRARAARADPGALERARAASACTYGGPRLQPEHFELARVPAEVARFGHGDAGAARSGSPGKVGVLELTFERRRASGPNSSRHYQKSPLQIMRPLYYDEARPDLPYTLRGDDRRRRAAGRPAAARPRFGRRRRRPRRHAGAHEAVSDGPRLRDIGGAPRPRRHAYVEHLPDPVIPYAGARFAQHRGSPWIRPPRSSSARPSTPAGCRAASATSTTPTPATSRSTIRTDGRSSSTASRLAPRSGAGLGVLAGHDIVATWLVVTPLVAARDLADALHGVAGGHDTGVSVLPADSGAWVRIVADDPVVVAATWRRLWETTRLTLTGHPPPPPRKY